MNPTLTKLSKVKALIEEVEVEVAESQGVELKTDLVDEFLSAFTHKTEFGIVRRDELWQLFKAWQPTHSKSYIGRRLFYRTMEDKGYVGVIVSLPTVNPDTGNGYVSTNVWRGLELKDVVTDY